MAEAVLIAVVFSLLGPMAPMRIAQSQEPLRISKPPRLVLPKDRPPKCANDIEVELRSGAIFRIDRRIINVFERKDSSDFLYDCSIERVQGGSFYVYSHYALKTPNFDGPTMPRRFTITGTYLCYGELCPRTTYRAYKVQVDGMLSGIEPHTVTEAGYLRYAKYSVFALPLERHPTQSEEPFTVSCTPSGLLPAECYVGYRVDDKVVVSYWFDQGRFAEQEWIELDLRMRRFVESIRVQ